MSSHKAAMTTRSGLAFGASAAGQQPTAEHGIGARQDPEQESTATPAKPVKQTKQSPATTSSLLKNYLATKRQARDSSNSGEPSSDAHESKEVAAQLSNLVKMLRLAPEDDSARSMKELHMPRDSEINAIMSKLEPGSTVIFCQDVWDCAASMHPHQMQILTLMHANAEVPEELAIYDRFLARVAKAAMDKQSPHVTRLKDKIRREGLTAMASGVRILGAVKNMHKAVSGPAARAIHRDFQDKVAFTQGMGMAAAAVAAKRVLTEAADLPRMGGSLTDPAYALINKIPDWAQASREKLEDDYVRADAAGLDRPYDEDQLVDVVAALVANARSPPPQFDLNATERGWRIACVRCGEDGHTYKNCKLPRCVSCDTDFCEGQRPGGKCFLTGDTPPTKITNALGRPCPPEIVAKAVTIYNKKKADVNTTEAEVDNLEMMSCYSNFDPHKYD